MESSKHFTTYFKSLEDLPGPSTCVSCEKLVSKSTSSSITKNCGKLKNKAWSDLKSYLNSNERIINRGEHRVPDDLVGLTVCKSCSSKLNANEIPRVCIANGMDTGTCPPCITELFPLESMFIHLAMCYQTVVKLSPMGAKIPYNARMASLKGFPVHIAAPIDVTLKDLFEVRPSRAVDPTDYMVLNGILKKDMITTLTVKEGGMAKLRASPLGNVSFSMATFTCFTTDNGTIVFIGDRESYLEVSLVEGSLQVTLRFNGIIEETISSGKMVVSTGSSKYITIDFTNSLSLYVDDILLDSAPLQEAMLEALVGFPSSSPYLGGLPDKSSSPGYTGCISDLVINSRIFDFTFDAVEKNNTILDRCKTIKRPDKLATLDLLDNVRSKRSQSLPPGRDFNGGCVSIQTVVLPQSYHLSSSMNKMNFLKLDAIKSNSMTVRFTFSFVLSTVSPSGILFYTESDNGKRLYLAFSGSLLTLTSDMGTSPLRVASVARINDGLPHKITIKRSRDYFQLIVDDIISSGTLRANSGMSVFALESDKTLNSCSNGICIGGAPSSVTDHQSIGFTQEFVGCFSEITFDQSDALKVIGSVPNCTSSASTSHFFNGQSAIVPDVRIKETDTVEIKFRSSRQTGTIVSFLNYSNSTILLLSLDKQQVLLTSGHVTVSGKMAESHFCDSTVPHSLIVQLRRDSVRYTIDGETGVALTREMDVLLDDVASLRLGDKFAGCMEDPFLNGEQISLANPRENTGVLLNSCPTHTF